MGVIRADGHGLAALAAICQEQSAIVGSVNAQPPPGDSFQATAAAVETGHADVVATGAQFMARMKSTADDVAAAAKRTGSAPQRPIRPPRSAR